MASAHVVYATITGNNEDVADIVTDKLEELGVDVEETEISQTDAEELNDVDICIVCPYTYDEGELPEEGMDFYEDLQDLDLTGKVYGVAGSGDVFYEDDFNVAVDAFSAAFKTAKATRVPRMSKSTWNPMKTTSKPSMRLSKKLSLRPTPKPLTIRALSGYQMVTGNALLVSCHWFIFLAIHRWPLSLQL